MKGKWRGAKWAPIRNGKCVKHSCAVTRLLKMCLQCHLEQMKAAGHNLKEENE